MNIETTEHVNYTLEIKDFFKSEFFEKFIHLILDKLNYADKDYLSFLYKKICDNEWLDPVEIETLRRFFHKEKIINELRKAIKIINKEELINNKKIKSSNWIEFLTNIFLENDVEKIKSEILAILQHFNTILKQIGWEYEFCWGFSWWIWKVKKNDWYRYFINKEWIEIWPFNYVYWFNDWIWIVEWEDWLKYYISELWNIISIWFYECFLFTDWIWVIKNDNWMFLVNKKIEQIAWPFDNCTSLVDWIWIVYKDWKYYYINWKWNIISNDYEHLEYFINWFWRWKKNSLWYLIDKKWNEHWPYRNIYLVRYWEWIVEDTSWNYKIITIDNENSQTSIKNNINDKTFTIKVKKTKWFYFLNRDLEIIWWPYEYCSDFINWFAKVKKNWVYYLLCRSWREYWPYNNCWNVEEYVFFYQGKEWNYFHHFLKWWIKQWPFVYCSWFKEWVCIIWDSNWNYYFSDRNYSKIWNLYKKCKQFTWWFWIWVKEDWYTYYITKKWKEFWPFLEWRQLNNWLFVVKDLNWNRQIRNHRFELMRWDIKEIVEINEWVITVKLKNWKYIYLQIILKKALDCI